MKRGTKIHLRQILKHMVLKNIQQERMFSWRPEVILHPTGNAEIPNGTVFYYDFCYVIQQSIFISL